MVRVGFNERGECAMHFVFVFYVYVIQQMLLRFNMVQGRGCYGTF